MNNGCQHAMIAESRPCELRTCFTPPWFLGRATAVHSEHEVKMTTQPIAVDNAIQVLNDALAADPAAVAALMAMETPCNDALADHPTIQVGESRLTPGITVVRPIGLINGLFGAAEDDWGFIAMEVDDSGRISEFLRIRG